MKKFLSKFNVFKNENGLTLLELIAVIAILGIMAAISFAAFSGQGEDARIKANNTNIQSIESAAERYDLEKGFQTGAATDDFKIIDKNHALVTGGYLKDVPKNPWAGTNKAQKNYVYIITKDSRGVFFAYLTDAAAGAATVTNVVDTDGTAKTIATLSTPLTFKAALPLSAGGDRYFHN